MLLLNSDYNYVRHNDQCVPVGPEPIPAGVCRNPDQMYEGSSGYRLIPGNTCDRSKGTKKDEPVKKKCSQGGLWLARAFLGGVTLRHRYFQHNQKRAMSFTSL